MKVQTGAMSLLGLALLLTIAWAGAASANECSETCSDARQSCMKARKIAHKECAGDCVDTLRDAITDARAVCERQELGDKACRLLVRRTVEGAQRACRADCRLDAGLAKTVCKDERRDCRVACSDATDPECREPCLEDFHACREDQRECVDVCREDRRVASQACKAEMGEVCDPDMLRECLQQARGDSRACVRSCHEDTSCGETLRECVGDCADDAFEDVEEEQPL